MPTANLPAIRACRPAWNKGRIVGQKAAQNCRWRCDTSALPNSRKLPVVLHRSGHLAAMATRRDLPAGRYILNLWPLRKAKSARWQNADTLCRTGPSSFAIL